MYKEKRRIIFDKLGIHQFTIEDSIDIIEVKLWGAGGAGSQKGNRQPTGGGGSCVVNLSLIHI